MVFDRREMKKAETISREIRRRLAEVRSTWLKVKLRSHGSMWITLSISLWFLLVLLELLFRFESPTRTALALFGILFSGISFVWFVLRPLLLLSGILRAPSDLGFAHTVGDFFPQVRDRLVNLLQLHDEASGGTLYSPELIDASFEDLVETIQPLDFRRAVDRSPVRRASKTLAGSIIVTFVVVALAPGTMGNAALRMLFFQQDFVPPAEFVFEVSPGSREILKGESVTIRVRVLAAAASPIGREPLFLRWRPEGQADLEEIRLVSDSVGRFETTLENLRNNTEYFAVYQTAESEHFNLLVIDRPGIRTLQVRLDYPAYSKLPPRIQDEFVGDVAALPGTVITLTGLSNKQLTAGDLVFGSGERVPLEVEGSRFSLQFALKKAGTYHLELTDAEHLKNPDPVSYQLALVDDAFPSIAILRPGRNLDIAGASSLPLLLQVKDDFGFSKLHLSYRLIHSRYEMLTESFSSVTVPLPSSSVLQTEFPFDWNLTPLTLAPEDVVQYFAEVFDNDVVSGPKSSRSPFYTLRFPSLEEVFADLDRGHEQTIEELKNSVEEARELKERIESISRDLKTNKPLDWQQQKQAEETAKKYGDLKSKLQDVRQRVDAMIQQIQQQKVLSNETLEKYLELQQLFEQLDSKELQEAFQKMQQALQTLNKQQLQQALQQLTFSEERFRESIQRTLDLLKRIQIEQKLDELRKRALEMASAQEKLQKETELSESDQALQLELASRQEDLAKKLQQMQEASEEVQKRMEEFFTEMPERELQEANQQLREKALGERMSQAGQQLRQNQLQQAQQNQRMVQRNLQQFSEQLDGIQMQMMQQQQQHIINELRRAISNLLELSKREELLKEQSKTAPQNSPQLRQNAQEQMSVIQDLGNVISSLQELSRRSFAVTPEMGRAIGEALAHMQNSMSALETRTGGLASQEQEAAMSSLNKAAQQVQSSLQALMQSAGQGSGLLGQLQGLAGQQMSLNMRTQTLEDAARLAVEQEAIRKSLEQLNKEALASGEQRRILGDLERIAREMQEVVRNLEQNNVDQETIQKQERILSRLLDAARSARERDFEKKRKAETGTQVARRSPGDLDPSTLEGRSRLREDLYKALQRGYSRDYEQLIRKYFEELEKIATP